MERYLSHHGIKGMKWGVRRFQNQDGTLTEAGKKRYLKSDGSLTVRGKLALGTNYDSRQADLPLKKGRTYSFDRSLGLVDMSKKTQAESARLDRLGDSIGARYNETWDALSKEVPKLKDNRELLDEGATMMRQAFGDDGEKAPGARMTDDPVYASIVSEEIAEQLCTKYLRNTEAGRMANDYANSVSGWFDDARKTVDNIVESTGDFTVTDFSTMKTTSYRDVLDRTLMSIPAGLVVAGDTHEIIKDALDFVDDSETVNAVAAQIYQEYMGEPDPERQRH